MKTLNSLSVGVYIWKCLFTKLFVLVIVQITIYCLQLTAIYNFYSKLLDIKIVLF